MVTKFRFNRFSGTMKNIQMWLWQNEAEVIDGFDGCLLDNTFYACKNGIATFYESYVNPNESEYIVYFARDSHPDDIQWVEDEWNKRIIAYEDEMGLV